jgi:hypothetical protein
MCIPPGKILGTPLPTPVADSSPGRQKSPAEKEKRVGGGGYEGNSYLKNEMLSRRKGRSETSHGAQTLLLRLKKKPIAVLEKKKNM